MQVPPDSSSESVRPSCRSRFLPETAHGAFISLSDKFRGKLPGSLTSPRFENNSIQATPPIAELLEEMGAVIPSDPACLGGLYVSLGAQWEKNAGVKALGPLAAVSREIKSD